MAKYKLPDFNNDTLEVYQKGMANRNGKDFTIGSGV